MCITEKVWKWWKAVKRMNTMKGPDKNKDGRQRGMMIGIC